MRASLLAICVLAPSILIAQTPSQHGAFLANVQAASAGDPHAQYMLGEAYRLGQGVGQDMNIAEDWYRRAATQGDRGAARELGLKLGADQIWREAIIWLNFANAGGDPKATALLAARATTSSTAHDRLLALKLIEDAKREEKGPTRRQAIPPSPTTGSDGLANAKSPQRAGPKATELAASKSPTPPTSDQRTIVLQLGAYGSAARAESAWASATEKLPSLRNEHHLVSPAGAAFRLTVEMPTLAAARALSDRLTRVVWPTIIRSN